MWRIVWRIVSRIEPYVPETAVSSCSGLSARQESKRRSVVHT